MVILGPAPNHDITPSHEICSFQVHLQLGDIIRHSNRDANAELIASAPRLKEERDELLKMVKNFADAVHKDSSWGIFMMLKTDARELIERIA